jgi:WhiB family redox-sensing transcriptional regulator
MKHSDWMRHAACHDTGSERVFFDDTGNVHGKTSMTTRVRRWRAKQLCAQCPVALECLQHATRAGSDFGVYGGLDQLERAAVRGARKDRPLTAANTVVIATCLQTDGIPDEEIAERIGISEERLTELLRRAVLPPSGQLAVREYEAWPSVAAGCNPDEVVVKHRIPYAHAEEMCKTMDLQPDYKGPRGRERYERRDQRVTRGCVGAEQRP